MVRHRPVLPHACYAGLLSMGEVVVALQLRRAFSRHARRRKTALELDIHPLPMVLHTGGPVSEGPASRPDRDFSYGSVRFRNGWIVRSHAKELVTEPAFPQLHFKSVGYVQVSQIAPYDAVLIRDLPLVFNIQRWLAEISFNDSIMLGRHRGDKRERGQADSRQIIMSGLHKASE